MENFTVYSIDMAGKQYSAIGKYTSKQLDNLYDELLVNHWYIRVVNETTGQVVEWVLDNDENGSFWKVYRKFYFDASRLTFNQRQNVTNNGVYVSNKDMESLLDQIDKKEESLRYPVDVRTAVLNKKRDIVGYKTIKMWEDVYPCGSEAKHATLKEISELTILFRQEEHKLNPWINFNYWYLHGENRFHYL